MNQHDIGQFIAAKRREQNLTQNQNTENTNSAQDSGKTFTLQYLISKAESIQRYIKNKDSIVESFLIGVSSFYEIEFNNVFILILLYLDNQ